jgi:hypothetical protein
MREWRLRVREATSALMSVETMTPDIKRALELAYPGEDARYFSPMAIGSDPATADEGAAAILGRHQNDHVFGILGLAGWPDSFRRGPMRSAGRTKPYARDHRD